MADKSLQTMLGNYCIKTLLLVLVCSVCTASAAAESFQGYKDIYLKEEMGRLIFGNSKLTLEFDNTSGQWQSLAAKGIDGNMISPSNFAAIDFKIDGKAIIRQRGASFLKHQIVTEENRKAVSLNLVFGIPATNESGKDRKPTTANYEYEFTCRYALFADEGRLDRSAKLHKVSDSNSLPNGIVRMSGFIFQLPGVVIGDSADCVVDVPGPFWPNNYIAPETPYNNLTNVTKDFHSAPDAGFGLLLITNNRCNTTLASWMQTGGEVNYGSSLSGNGKRIIFSHHNHRAYRLKKQMTVESDVHRIEVVAGGLPAALAKYRNSFSAICGAPLDPNTPAWAHEITLLEAYPQYYSGGFKELTGKLPFYKEMGFNTIYLMPHWVGGYSPIDPLKVDERFGTTDDLKEMVRTAHSLGMRVLLDMVIHGFNEKSPLPKERPELFVHNEYGGLARHPAWKSITTDWASPAYQQYMVDLVLHDLKTYDIDGYRVDAASYKGPNWDPNIPYPAYLSGTAAPQLLRRMLKAMREVKPDCVFLSEVFGPVYYSVCNLVHDNQTEGPQFLLEQMEAGLVNAAHYKKHIANILDALPAGANRVYFTRNHDTSWFYHFNGYTQRFMAMEAIHLLCAIPEVFAGDPRHGPDPDDDPATYEYYRKVFALRKKSPELAKGELLLREVECDNPWVFTGLQRLNDRKVLVLVSLSGKQENTALRISNWESRILKFQLEDPISGDTVEAIAEGQNPQTIGLTLKPFQVLVGRL
jgi:glycosidase